MAGSSYLDFSRSCRPILGLVRVCPLFLAFYQCTFFRKVSPTSSSPSPSPPKKYLFTYLIYQFQPHVSGAPFSFSTTRPICHILVAIVLDYSAFACPLFPHQISWKRQQRAAHSRSRFNHVKPKEKEKDITIELPTYSATSHKTPRHGSTGTYYLLLPFFLVAEAPTRRHLSYNHLQPPANNCTCFARA